MDQLIENALNGAYNGKPAKYSLLFRDLAKLNLFCHVARLQSALHKGKLVEELNHILKDKEDLRP